MTPLFLRAIKFVIGGAFIAVPAGQIEAARAFYENFAKCLLDLLRVDWIDH